MLAGTYPATVVCETFGCPRSSYYYAVKGEGGDRALKQAIEGVLVEFPTYGYRRVTKQLRRQGWEVNHKRVARVMREAGLQGKVKRGRCRTTDSDHGYPQYPNLVLGLAVTRPDQVWVSDITYIRLRYEFVYLAVIMDVFTRCIRGWHLGRGLDQSLTLLALEQALAHHTPEIHHSDQGVQYAATAYTERLQEVGAQISMAERGEAWQNGYAERLIRTIKEEEVSLSEYEDYTEALQQIGRFLDEVYMHKRIHSSLGYLTPAEFAEQWRKEQEGALSLKTP